MRIHYVASVSSALFVGCSSQVSSDTPPTSVAASDKAPAHLVGEHVKRYPEEPNFTERYRYVLQGQRIGKNCAYHSGPAVELRPSEIETVREEDFDRCLALRVVGSVKGHTYKVPPTVTHPGDSVRVNRGAIR